MKIALKVLAILLSLSILPIVILGIITTGDLREMNSETTRVFADMSSSVVEESNDAVTALVGESFTRQGLVIVETIVSMLEEREQDTIYLAGLIAGEDDRERIKDIISTFHSSHQKKIWYNTHTDQDPVEETEIIPLYSSIAYIGPDGIEIVRMEDGIFSSDLRDVSDPANTHYKSESYFSKTIGSDEIYVSKLNTWYTTTSESRAGAPPDTTAYDVVPGRDIMKSGDIKFAKRAGDGIIVLGLDYRHIQALTKHIDPASHEKTVSASYEGNYILFYDDDGNTIVHPKPNNIRGYLEDGTLEHTNTVDTPGGIFNLKDYDKTDAYQKMYAKTIIEKQAYVSSSTDVSGRNKMTIAIPIPYDKGEYAQTGAFGGIMMSVNTDIFYASVHQIETDLTSTVGATKFEIIKVIEDINTQMSLLIITTLLIVILSGLFFARRITKPITDLTVAGKSIADGNLSAEIPSITTKDEVEELSHTMGLLIGSLKYHMKNKPPETKGL